MKAQKVMSGLLPPIMAPLFQTNITRRKKVKICRDVLTPSSTGKHSITSTTHPIPHIKTKSVDDGLRNIMLTLTLFLYGASHEGEPVLLPGFAIIG